MIGAQCEPNYNEPRRSYCPSDQLNCVVVLCERTTRKPQASSNNCSPAPIAWRATQVCGLPLWWLVHCIRIRLDAVLRSGICHSSATRRSVKHTKSTHTPPKNQLRSKCRSSGFNHSLAKITEWCPQLLCFVHKQIRKLAFTKSQHGQNPRGSMWHVHHATSLIHLPGSLKSITKKQEKKTLKTKKNKQKFATQSN